MQTVMAIKEHFRLESESQVEDKEEEDVHGLIDAPQLTISLTVNLSPLSLGGSVRDSVTSPRAKDMDPKGKSSAPLISSDPKIFVDWTIGTRLE